MGKNENLLKHTVKYNISCHIEGQEVTAFSDLGPPNVRSPKREHNACDPTDAATPHGDCWGAGTVVGEGWMQEAAICHICHSWL